MLPATIALIEDHADFRDVLTHFLQEAGMQVSAFDDSDTLLVDRRAFDFDFYCVDLGLPGVDGVDLIRILRRRTSAGIVVVSARSSPEAFAAAMQAGADMFLTKPVRFEQVLISIEAVHRRAAGVRTAGNTWRVDREARELIAPNSKRAALSPAQLEIVSCFLAAGGSNVPHKALTGKLAGGQPGEVDNALHAAIYRLRRHVERSTELAFPLQSVSRVGYVFKAPLQPA